MDKIKTVWSPAVGSYWNDFKNWILTDVKKIFQEELNFNIKDAYRLSWDDKYAELCKEQNKEIEKIVRFNKNMPQIFKKFTLK